MHAQVDGRMGLRSQRSVFEICIHTYVETDFQLRKARADDGVRSENASVSRPQAVQLSPLAGT